MVLSNELVFSVQSTIGYSKPRMYRYRVPCFLGLGKMEVPTDSLYRGNVPCNLLRVPGFPVLTRSWKLGSSLKSSSYVMAVPGT